MKICIIIPIYNEAGTIGQIVQAIRAKGMDVLVIDDGSSDGGGAMARAHGAALMSAHRAKAKARVFAGRL